MSKKSKKPTASASASLPKGELIYIFGGENDWGGQSKRFEVRIAEKGKPQFKGGWISNDSKGKMIFRAYFGTEESCCGFPIMMDFWENKDAYVRAKEIGTRLGEWLSENCVYMAAYIPERPMYKAAKAVLQAAGFKIGLSLNSTHGKYKNHRMEWFTSVPNKEIKVEKTVAPLAV